MWLAPKAVETGHDKNDKKQWIPHIPFGHNLHLCNLLHLHKVETFAIELRTVRRKSGYLQSGSVHISRQFSSPSTGYHEHFIGIHLQRETLISAQVKPTRWSEAFKAQSFIKQMVQNKVFREGGERGVIFTVLPVTEGTLGTGA